MALSDYHVVVVLVDIIMLLRRRWFFDSTVTIFRWISGQSNLAATTTATFKGSYVAPQIMGFAPCLPVLGHCQAKKL